MVGSCVPWVIAAVAAAPTTPPGPNPLGPIGAPPGKPAPKAPLLAIVLGIGQPNGAAHAAKAKSLLEPHLAKALGGAVRVDIRKDYDDLAAVLAGGKVDLAWITPVAFVNASTRNAEVRALVKAKRRQKSFYRSVFIVRKDSTAKSLKDVKGKRVVWVSKGSASGYVFPRGLLTWAGQDPDHFFGAASFAGSHPEVCKAVRDGKADVGATLADPPEPGGEMVADGCDDAPPAADFRVVAASEPIPNDVIAGRAGLDAGVVRSVLDAFGKMGESADGKRVLADAFRVDGWAAATDHDFDAVLKVLGIAPAGASPPEPEAVAPPPGAASAAASPPAPATPPPSVSPAPPARSPDGGR